MTEKPTASFDRWEEAHAVCCILDKPIVAWMAGMGIYKLYPSGRVEEIKKRETTAP